MLQGVCVLLSLGELFKGKYGSLPTQIMLWLPLNDHKDFPNTPGLITAAAGDVNFIKSAVSILQLRKLKHRRQHPFEQKVHEVPKGCQLFAPSLMLVSSWV